MLENFVNFLRSNPVKSIFIVLIVVAILATGVRNIYMATGNDTLVESDSDVFKDNEMLEEEFGGESIIVLYESDHLLTPENLGHMKGLEDRVYMSDSIYTVISPITLVEEITNRQADQFQNGIEEVIDGLETMGEKLIEISTEMTGNMASDGELDLRDLGELEMPNLGGAGLPELGGLELPDLQADMSNMELPELESPQLPEFPEMEMPDLGQQVSELNTVFEKLIYAQENLGGGTQILINGYTEFGTKLIDFSNNLNLLASQMEGSSEQAGQLQQMSTGLSHISEQMLLVSEKTADLPNISESTVEGLENIQENLSSSLKEQEEQQVQLKNEQAKMMENIQTTLKDEQVAQQEQIKTKLQEEQRHIEAQLKQEMEKQLTEQKQAMGALQNEQEQLQKEIEEEMLVQQREKELQMEAFKEDMQGNLDEQKENISQLSDGLKEMGAKLLTISENMGMIYDYSDIMTPSLPTKQSTLNNIVYDDEGEIRGMFEEVLVDDHHMMMMIKLEGGTDDTEKAKILDGIHDYVDSEVLESAEILVSGKPVLDHSIRSSMMESVQQMMILAIGLMIIILFIVFRVRWRLMPLLTVFVAVIGTVGFMGWFNIPITMVSMAVFPILIGLGADYAIQFQNRYVEEMARAKEDSNE